MDGWDEMEGSTMADQGLVYGLRAARDGWGCDGAVLSMVEPAVAPGCRWTESGGHLRLVVTDPFHPVTAATVTALRDGCGRCRIVGVAPDVARRVAPPGVDAVEVCPADSEVGFAPAVLAVAHRTGCDLVLPWSDRDALALAGSAMAYRESGVSLLCPRADLVALACDKWAMLQRLDELGVPVAASMLVEDGQGLYEAAEAMGYPARRLVLKPRRTSGGRGVWALRRDADPFGGGFPPELSIDAMALAVHHWARWGRRPVDLVLQEQLDGVDVSVDVLADDGEIVVAVARSRVASLGGLCVEGTVRPLTAAEWSLVETIVGQLRWSSLANVQLVAGPDGPAVYEINARAAGSIGISAYAGVDVLAAAISLARTGSAAGYGSEVVQPMRFRRHWLDQCWPGDPEGDR